MAELRRIGREGGFDVRQRLATINLRFTAAQQIQIGAVDQQQLAQARRSRFRKRRFCSMRLREYKPCGGFAGSCRQDRAVSRHLVIRSFRSCQCDASTARSEEHTSELQSLMRISYPVFCLTKKSDL